ncbi:MAG: hypothetical protein GXN99_02940 [Candidatus Nanohaloarchaeota archaeon]|nr:hypothetical protein [Candidatus Nanohaloarchaeota archaeon]
MKSFVKIFVALMLLIPLTHATTIEKEVITFDIKKDYQVIANITLLFKDITTSNISYFYTGQINNLKAYINGKEANCQIKNQKIGTEISCYKPADENITVTFLFNTSLLLQKQGLYHFNYELPVIYPTNEIKVKLILPEGSVVASSDVFATVTPDNYKIESDEKGRRFVIIWTIEKPELGKTYLFSAYFESQQQPQQHNINKNIMAMIAIGILSVIAVLIFLLIRVRRKQKEKIIEVLVEDEKKVIDAIKELGQGCKQKDVVKLTGFSKAKVSRIIEELKNRNVIEVERVGKHNKLYLKD